MKTLVLYASKYGNTEKIARAIYEVLGGRIANVTEFKPDMLDETDLLVVGSPIHSWQPSSETVRLLAGMERGSLEGKFVAAFDTGFKSTFSGNAAPKILKKLVRAGGKKVAPSQKFVVEKAEGPMAAGEIERAGAWGIFLKTEYEKATLSSGQLVG